VRARAPALETDSAMQTVQLSETDSAMQTETDRALETVTVTVTDRALETALEMEMVMETRPLQ
jgi:hypothetical protein